MNKFAGFEKAKRENTDKYDIILAYFSTKPKTLKLMSLFLNG